MLETEGGTPKASEWSEKGLEVEGGNKISETGRGGKTVAILRRLTPEGLLTGSRLRRLVIGWARGGLSILMVR